MVLVQGYIGEELRAVDEPKSWLNPLINEFTLRIPFQESLLPLAFECRGPASTTNLSAIENECRCIMN